MRSEFHLITEQDIHAYIDGELRGVRRREVEKFLAERSLPLERAARYLRNTFDLSSMRELIYADRALKNEVDRLLARRKQRFS